jgi:DNA-binding MarR family transcriptional regulator
MDKKGYNCTYFKIFKLLSCRGQASQLDIVKFTHLKAPTISITLKNMEQEGYIVREVDQNDQRSVIVRLTDYGIETDKNIKKVFRDEESKLINLFSEEEVEQINSYANRMIAYLEKEVE